MNDKLLERIAIALEKLAPAKNPLGFCEPPQPRHIYISNDSEQGLWYFLGESSVPNHIPQRALTCVIKNLGIVRREHKSKEQLKLDITVEADRDYVLRTGFNTTFCRGLLLALSTLSREQLSKPLTIAISPGEGKVVFARVYDAQTSRPITFEWDKEIDLMPILKKLQGMFAAWRNWKTPDDAIAWAAEQLPAVAVIALQKEFNELVAPKGKKAPAWEDRIKQLKAASQRRAS